MKAYRGSGRVEVQLHSFLPPVSDGGEWLTSRSSRFSSGKEPRYSLNRELGVPRVGLDILDKKKSLARTSTRTADRPARSLVVIQTTYGGGGTGRKYFCRWKGTNRGKPCNREKTVPVPLCVVDHCRDRIQQH
jgi:hypothetical protein